jgi:uncharacterized membrane protein
MQNIERIKTFIPAIILWIPFFILRKVDSNEHKELYQIAWAFGYFLYFAYFLYIHEALAHHFDKIANLGNTFFYISIVISLLSFCSIVLFFEPGVELQVNGLLALPFFLIPISVFYSIYYVSKVLIIAENEIRFDKDRGIEILKYMFAHLFIFVFVWYIFPKVKKVVVQQKLKDYVA